MDAGCGPGFFTRWLLDQGARVTAFDVTGRMVELTQARVGARATVLRHDLPEPLDFAADESFDWIICPLVLDYIEEWQPVLAEFTRVLKHGGGLVFSTGHPFGDYQWLKERRGLEVNYFESELVSAPWKGFGEPYPVIHFYRRPLQQVINPLLEAGLRLDYLLEPLPTEQYRRKDPENYQKLLKEPGFICIRARKP